MSETEKDVQTPSNVDADVTNDKADEQLPFENSSEKSDDPLAKESVNFYQGGTDRLKDLEGDKDNIEERLKAIKEAVQDFFNMRNIHFLFGSGTSTPAIPTMREMHGKVIKKLVEPNNTEILQEFNEISKRIKNQTNLEDILGVLYSHRSYLRNSNSTPTEEEDSVATETTDTAEEDIKDPETICNELIKVIEEVIFNSINIELFRGENLKTLPKPIQDNLSLYQEFYRKLALRNKDLARLNIFTTNNDLFNEYALDSLNIHYINGFGGGISKFFNPALFNYNFAKRMDTSIEKFEPVENMVYLYKIHGSINWVEDEQNANTYFNIKEVTVPENVGDKNVLIYPAPTKQNKSLGSPYVEMFREFQKKLLEPHSVLFISGYSFSDEHVNNIIYQALATNTTINVVILNDVSDTVIGKVDDNRIFKIWGQIFDSTNEAVLSKDEPSGEAEAAETTGSVGKSSMRKIHYFDYFVRELIPNIDAFKNDDDILGKFLKGLKMSSNKDERK